MVCSLISLLSINLRVEADQNVQKG